MFLLPSPTRSKRGIADAYPEEPVHRVTPGVMAGRTWGVPYKGGGRGSARTVGPSILGAGRGTVSVDREVWSGVRIATLQGRGEEGVGENVPREYVERVMRRVNQAAD